MRLLQQREIDAANYYEMIRSHHESQQILIHDIKKHLQSIDILNSQKEPEKISAYIRGLMISPGLKETGKLCESAMLNAILCRYKEQCFYKHIAFLSDVRHGTTDFISDKDLTALFCNLLDNAVNAADGIPDSYIELRASRRENTHMTVLSVVNSCRSDPFANFSHMPSDRSNRIQHGLGLKIIRRVVEQYNGFMKLYYDGETSTFHTIITLNGSPFGNMP